MMNRLSRISRATATMLASVVLVLMLSGAADDQNGGPIEQQGLGISDSFGKWPNGTFTWVYNSSLAPVGYTDDTATLALIEAAIDEWEEVCDVHFIFDRVDDSALITNLSDGEVVFQWEDISGAGLAGPAWNGAQDRTGPGHFEYSDGTLRLDPDVFSLDGLDADQIENRLVSFNQTVAHEVGHVIGLGHSDDHASIMFANPYNSLDHLRDDDIEACRSMYGYADLHSDPVGYAPMAAGTDPTDFVYLSAFSDFNTAITSDVDGTMTPFLDTDTLAVRWQITTTYDDTIKQTVVDPEGFKSVVASSDVDTMPPGTGGAFGIATFDRLRELPGLWTVYVEDSSGLFATLTIDVTAAPPTEIEAPVATLSVTENPATRATTITVDVASVSALAPTPTQATIDWHVGTVGNSQQTITVPGQAVLTPAVTFGDSLPHEVHVEVNDDRARPLYSGTPGGSTSGDGFQTLLRYNSTGVNSGTDGGGDNSSDILLYNPSNGEVFFWNMHGNLIEPRGAVADLVDTDWSIAGRGDYNGDGKSDILWWNTTTQQMYYWEMNGRSIESSAPVAVLNSALWEVIGDGDYTGDGRSDILFYNSATRQVYLWTMNGATITAAAQIAILQDANWQAVGDKDFDGDGIADIMWFNTVSGQVYFWKMNGSTITSAALVATLSDLAWGVVSDGDQDGDGNADLTWQRRGGGEDGKVYYWRMDGATILSSSRISIVGDQDWSVVGGGDLNGDGNADLTWFNSTSRQIYHWQQDGATTLRSGQISAALAAGWQIVNVN